MGTHFHFGEDENEIPQGKNDPAMWQWPFVYLDAAVVTAGFKLNTYRDSAIVYIRATPSGIEDAHVFVDSGIVIVNATPFGTEALLTSTYGTGTYGSGTYGNLNT